jgi:hypothetical protein
LAKDINNSSKIGEITSLLSNNSLYEVLEEHKQKLQSDVNSYVLKQDLINAYAALKAMKDAEKIIFLFQNRLTELKK